MAAQRAYVEQRVTLWRPAARRAVFVLGNSAVGGSVMNSVAADDIAAWWRSARWQVASLGTVAQRMSLQQAKACIYLFDGGIYQKKQMRDSVQFKLLSIHTYFWCESYDRGSGKGARMRRFIVQSVF